MARLKLSLACGDYELTRALIDETVRPEGIEFMVTTGAQPDRLRRMARFEEFDVCEYSLASYVVGKERGRALTAIPVFLHRRFRHSYIFCRNDGSVRGPKDLEHRRVGLRTYQAVVNVWCRGLLQDDYGVDLSSITWAVKDEEDESLSLEGRKVVRLEPEVGIEEALLDGLVDAVIHPETLPSLKGGQVQRVIDQAFAAERAYYLKQRIFPIMHVVVIKDAVLERFPWVARNVLEAFERAKQVAWRRLANPRRTPLVWVQEALEEQERLFDGDPFPYTVENNRITLETFLRYAQEQGLIRGPMRVEDLFPHTVQEPLPRYWEGYEH